METMPEIDEFEDFFKSQVVLRRTTPNAATKMLFEKYPSASSLSLCFAMTIVASRLDEQRHSGSTGEWEEWDRASYWLSVSSPMLYFSKLNVKIEDVVLEIYRTIAIITCDTFALKVNGAKGVRAEDLVQFWAQIGDRHFQEA